MKKLLLCILVCLASPGIAETKITPPDMALGHWVTTADMSGIIEQALSKVPEETRPMVRGMMEEQMKAAGRTEQCITEDTLSNFDQQVKDAFGKDSDCEMNVIESTSKNFEATLTCPGSVMQISTKVIDDKRNETVMMSNIDGLGETELSSVSEWQSSTCP